MVMQSHFSATPTPKSVLRTRTRLRSSLRRLADALDKSGQTTAPISLPCTYVELCRLGLTPYGGGQFLFASHPVKAVQHG